MDRQRDRQIHRIVIAIAASCDLLVFCCNSRSMTLIAGQVTVDGEEQWLLLQDILEAAIDGHRV